MARKKKPKISELDVEEARTRIQVALARLADLATMDDPDEMISCISDVEAILEGEAK